MDQKRGSQLYDEFAWRETEELVEIWKAHNRYEWTEEAFEAIREVLLTRLDTLPTYEDIYMADQHLEQSRRYAFKGEYVNALTECELAIQAAASYPEGYWYKATVLEKMGRYEDAIESSKIAVQFKSSTTDPYKNLQQKNDAASHEITSAEERILSALAHAGFIVPTYGILIPILIWILDRKKSPYVAFQSLQALAIQALAFFLTLAAGLVTVIPFIFIGISNVERIGFISTVWLFPFLVFGFLFILCVQGILVIYGSIAAISTLLSKDFRYILIGDLISRFIRN